MREAMMTKTNIHYSPLFDSKPHPPTPTVGGIAFQLYALVNVVRGCDCRVSTLTNGRLVKVYFLPKTYHDRLSQFHVPCSGFASFTENTNKDVSLNSTSFPIFTLLWKYSLQFSGFLDAPSDLVSARKLLMERMAADPGSFISKLEPAEPTAQTLVDLGKRVFGMK